jgi:hypothetical protein
MEPVGPKNSSAVLGWLGLSVRGMRTRPLLLESFRLVYWALRRMFKLLSLPARSEQRKEVEILLLRHVMNDFLRPALRARLDEWRKLADVQAWPAELVFVWKASADQQSLTAIASHRLIRTGRFRLILRGATLVCEWTIDTNPYRIQLAASRRRRLSGRFSGLSSF